MTDSNRTIVASNLETANLIEGYHVIAEWIRFADAKAAVVLTVGGAIAGLVIPTLKSYLDEDVAAHPTVWWTKLVIGLFAVWLLLLLVSGICAFRCILPFRRKGKHPALGHSSHFHPAAICTAFKLDDVERWNAMLPASHVALASRVPPVGDGPSTSGGRPKADSSDVLTQRSRLRPYGVSMTLSK